MNVKALLKSTAVVIAFGVGSFVMSRIGAKLRERERKPARFVALLEKEIK
jgi:hypothetical protein